MILIHSPSTASNCELFDFLGFVQFEFFIFLAYGFVYDAACTHGVRQESSALFCTCCTYGKGDYSIQDDDG